MERLPELGTLSDLELKELIAELQEEENKISFARRTLHARIDLLRAGVGQGSPADVSSVAEALSAKPVRSGPLSAEAAAQLERLDQHEEAISKRRRELHGQIDLLRTELVARLQRTGGASVLSEVDAAALARILAERSSAVG